MPNPYPMRVKIVLGWGHTAVYRCGMDADSASNFALITPVFCLPFFGIEIPRVSIEKQRMVLSIFDTETASKINMIAAAQISPIEIELICAENRSKNCASFTVAARKTVWNWRVNIALRRLDMDLVRIHTKLQWAGFYKIHIKICIYILKSASKIHADFRCRFRSEIFSVHLPFSALMFAHMTGKAKTAVCFQGQPAEL